MNGKQQILYLKKCILLNGQTIRKALVDLAHINYGVNKQTNELNDKCRTSFTLSDVEKFILMLDGEFIYPKKHRGRISRFEIRIDCPVHGRFQSKEFVMVFETDYDKNEEICMITLFPGW